MKTPIEKVIPLNNISFCKVNPWITSVKGGGLLIFSSLSHFFLLCFTSLFFCQRQILFCLKIHYSLNSPTSLDKFNNQTKTNPSILINTIQKNKFLTLAVSNICVSSITFGILPFSSRRWAVFPLHSFGLLAYQCFHQSSKVIQNCFSYNVITE